MFTVIVHQTGICQQQNSCTSCILVPFVFFRYLELKVVGCLNEKLQFLCIQNFSMAEIDKRVGTLNKFRKPYR
jgi:hypothetical protein